MVLIRNFLDKKLLDRISSKTKKEKAIFMIFLLISSVFYFSLNLEDVEAQSRQNRQQSSLQKACCEKTKTGDYCVYTERNNCDTDFRNSLTTCENTNYCSLGTCIYDKEGDCFGNTPKALCEKNNGVWTKESIDEVSQCQKGCCQLGNECSFITQNKCKSETSKFPNLNTVFDSSINNEGQCIDKCRSEEKGACVSSDGSCTFTTRSACIEQGEGFLENNNETEILQIKTGFHANVLCSNPLLGTNCARQQKTGCFNEKVYWLDSCGNTENVYSSDKDKSYNKGFILKESESCKLKGPNDPNCGNCDYSQGTLCGESPDNVNMVFGEFSCNDLRCNELTINEASPDSSGEKETGESWCLYDAKVGFGQDVVGSRHYRALCLNGEEVIEPCKDYREEICIQGVSGAIKDFNLGQVFNIGEGYLESACRSNRFQQCNSCNEVLGNCGGECNNLKGKARVGCCRAKCCEDIENKDCYYLPAGVTDFGGICTPMVPPGLQFWRSGEGGGGSEEGTQTGPKSVCEEGNLECKVKWVRGGTARFGIGGLGTEKDWVCVKNCHCLEKKWVVAGATQCKARGDCGAWYNIEGEFTSGGFSEDTDFVLTQKDFDDWSTISRQSLRKDDPTNMGAFFTRTWPALTVIFGTGIGAGIVSIARGGTFLSSAFSGLFLGPKSVLTLGRIGGVGPNVETVYLEAFRQPIKVFPQAAVKGNMLAGASVPERTTHLMYKGGEEGWVFVDNIGKTTGTATPEQVATATDSVLGGQSTLLVALEVLNVLAWLYTIYTLIDYFGKQDKEETFTISCNTWEAPKGGEDCEKCNEDGKTCSEYRCRSLGKLCRLINEGTSEERCVAQTTIDTNSPIISAVKPKDLEIDEKKNQGYIVKTLVKPFTPVELGISTDEPSKCKFELEVGKKYEDMRFDFGDSLFRYNHTMLFSLPGDLQNESILRLTNGGKYNLYLRCSDNNENANNKDYYIKFEIDKGPDLTAPKIELTSIKNNGYISSELNDVGLDIFVNEPSECKWDRRDVDYDDMGNSFICARSGLDITPINQGLYRCTTLLNKLEKGKNNFYFRCKDKPLEKEGRNVNSESYSFSLIKTEKLEIDKVEPKGKVFRANPSLYVKTLKGAQNGVSICGYSTNKDSLILNIPQFSDTNSSEHGQQLRNLVKGKYTYYVTCIDEAGNIAKDLTQFEILTSLEQPVISQVYKNIKNNILVVNTNEDSNCEYDNKEFNFGEGIKMTDPNSKRHEAALTSDIYYVKCKDVFENSGSVIVYP